MDDEVARRLGAIEARLAALEPGARVKGGPAAGEFWVLDGIEERSPADGAIVFAGTVDLPTGEHYRWQETHQAAELLERDWSRAADRLAALAHPARLDIVRNVLNGARTTAELQDGTSGQFHHHVRQLVAAGWLRLAARGHYVVPPDRIVPVLALIAEVDR